MTMVPAKLELAKVLRKMAAGHMNVCAFDGAFKQAPEALNRVRVVPAPYPFVLSMVHGAVLVAAPHKPGIGSQFIGADRGACLDVLKNVLLKGLALNVIDYAGHHVAAALDHAEDNRLAGCSTPAFSGTLAANHRFVDLDVALKRRIAVHPAKVFADLMAHAPRSFVIHRQLTLQFLRRNAVPRRREKVDRIE